MNNQIKNIENKIKAKHKKDLLNVYSKDGDIIGEGTRQNCHKLKFKNYYKTAVLIIRNKANKYLVYQQILNYENSECCWKATYCQDELSKQNLKDSFINETKTRFGLVIGKKSFKLVNKTINTDKHQIIEVYIVEEDFCNSNVDYNIDLYYTAKFTFFKRFIKILTLSKDLPEDLINEIKDTIGAKPTK